MQCELCGKDTEKILKVSIEGVEMDVCTSCSRHGKRISRPRVQKAEVRKKSSTLPQREEFVEEILPDYSQKIKSAISKRDAKLEHLAKRLGLKESQLRHYERGTMKPSISDARNLERFFGIKIVDNVKVKTSSEVMQGAPSGSAKGLTIGDMIKVRKKA